MSSTSATEHVVQSPTKIMKQSFISSTSPNTITTNSPMIPKRKGAMYSSRGVPISPTLTTHEEEEEQVEHATTTTASIPIQTTSIATKRMQRHRSAVVFNSVNPALSSPTTITTTTTIPTIPTIDMNEVMDNSTSTAPEAVIYSPATRMELDQDYFDVSSSSPPSPSSFSKSRSRSSALLYGRQTLPKPVPSHPLPNTPPIRVALEKPKASLPDQQKLLIMHNNNRDTARAIEEYESEAIGEISLQLNDILHIFRETEDGMSYVLNVTTSKSGLVPTSYYYRIGHIQMNDAIRHEAPIAPKKPPPPIPADQQQQPSSSSSSSSSDYQQQLSTLTKLPSKLIKKQLAKQKKKKTCKFLAPYVTEGTPRGLSIADFNHLLD
jgi:hypothetical protein